MRANWCVDLQSAAERLGVHYQTAYRWIRDGSLPARKVGSSYVIAPEDLDDFARRRAEPAPPPKRTNVRDWAAHVDRLFRFAAEGDELGARQVVDRLHEGGIEPIDLCEELFTPVLRRIGEGWACGDLSVAHEHRASAICERLLARIAVHPRGRPRGVCVVATPDGEEHSLPAAMAAVVLRADRWQVHHLGVKVPTPDAIDLIRAVRAELVVLSATTPELLATCKAVSEEIAAATGLPVLLGHPGSTLRHLVSEARQAS